MEDKLSFLRYRPFAGNTISIDRQSIFRISPCVGPASSPTSCVARSFIALLIYRGAPRHACTRASINRKPGPP